MPSFEISMLMFLPLSRSVENASRRMCNAEAAFLTSAILFRAIDAK
jgi:hypothetical protein